MHMQNIEKVFTISGLIGSGKSYTANLISSKLGFPVASFGGYLKHYSLSNGLPIDRKTLQDLGAQLIEKKPSKFLFDTINFFRGDSDSIIIEGVRHKLILEMIIAKVPKTISIFVETDLSTRYNRYVSRNKESDSIKTFQQFSEYDNHPVEREINSLKEYCSYVFNTNGEFNSDFNNFLDHQ